MNKCQMPRVRALSQNYVPSVYHQLIHDSHGNVANTGECSASNVCGECSACGASDVCEVQPHHVRRRSFALCYPCHLLFVCLFAQAWGAVLLLSLVFWLWFSLGYWLNLDEVLLQFLWLQQLGWELGCHAWVFFWFHFDFFLSFEHGW